MFNVHFVCVDSVLHPSQYLQVRNKIPNVKFLNSEVLDLSTMVAGYQIRHVSV